MPLRVARYWVSSSMSSARPSPARAMPTLASRTSGCWVLSACEQRATVRWASSAVITPSASSHCTSLRQSRGPEGLLGTTAGFGGGGGGGVGKGGGAGGGGGP